jgi:hypothetical protein
MSMGCGDLAPADLTIAGVGKEHARPEHGPANVGDRVLRPPRAIIGRLDRLIAELGEKHRQHRQDIAAPRVQQILHAQIDDEARVEVPELMRHGERGEQALCRGNIRGWQVHVGTVAEYG